MSRLKFLSSDKIESIHKASLEILEKTGVIIKNELARNLLYDHGCSVENLLVRFPNSLIEECIKKVPSSFELASREGEDKMIVGGDNVIFNPGSAAIYFIDTETDEMRRALSKDLVKLVRLVDGLEYIKAQSTAMVPADIPEEISDLYRLYIVLMNSTKPVITGAFTIEGLIDMMNLLQSVTREPNLLTEAPRAIFDCCPSSPLMWSDVTCQNVIDCAVNGIPAEIISAPQMGATSPVTIAGTLVESNAEILSGIAISQLVKPGAPVVYGGSPAGFDMKYCTTRLGAVEAMLAACAGAEMGKYYGIPTQAYLGLSDSKTVNGQSAFESTLGIVMAAEARINIVSGPGMLASENCQSLEKLILDNEICGTTYRLIDGISVGNEDLATELIHKVGPGGHFLAEKHTRENLMKERFIPSNVLCRLSPDAWVNDGRKDTLIRSKEAVKRILKEHHPEPLPKKSEEELNETFKKILKRRGIPISKVPRI